MRELLIRILKGVIEHWLVTLLAVSGTAVGGWFLWLYRTYLKDWLLSIWYVEMPGWAWFLIFVFEICLIVYFICQFVEKLARLKNVRDIVKAIEDWLTNGDEYGDMPKKNTPYFFTGIEKSLNIKRGRSKTYLPLVAYKHGYGFHVGKKTFTLTDLTSENDPISIFEHHMKPLETGGKEVLLSCKDIDDELGWPKGVAKLLLLNMSLKNVDFEIEIKDMGAGKIRIIRKE